MAVMTAVGDKNKHLVRKIVMQFEIACVIESNVRIRFDLDCFKGQGNKSSKENRIVALR